MTNSQHTKSGGVGYKHTFSTNTDAFSINYISLAQVYQHSDKNIYHMTRTALRALSLQNHWWKSRMRDVRIYASGAGKSRTALPQKRSASGVKTSRKFVPKLVIIIIKYLLTKSGRAGWENIWLSVMAYGPRCARSARHDLEPNIFPSGPPT